MTDDATPGALRPNDGLGQVSEAERLVAYLKTYPRSDGIDAAVRLIESQAAELARCGKDNCMGRKVQSTTTWVTWEAREAAVAAERERWHMLITGPHTYDGDCPDAENWHSRDPECPACAALGDWRA